MSRLCPLNDQEVSAKKQKQASGVKTVENGKKKKTNEGMRGRFSMKECFGDLRGFKR